MQSTRIMLQEATRRAWTMWLAVWVTTVLSSLLAVAALSLIASATFEASLVDGLAARLHAQAGLTAAALRQTPIESVAALAGTRSTDRLQADLEGLRDGAELHELALLGPRGEVYAAGGGPLWIVAEADAVLIEDARAGSPRVGPLYRGVDGAPYLAAYAPLPDHAGWLVAVEGSGASLEAADRMRWTLAGVSALVLALAVALGAGLAAAVTRPMRALARGLDAARPGAQAPPVSTEGPREVRLVAEAAERLLEAVRERDQELLRGRNREIRQVTALAAAVAHEVRNPLNALGLALHRLERADAEGAAGLRTRIRAALDEIEGIVDRFLDLSRPPVPDLRMVHLDQLFANLSEEAAAAGIELHAECREVAVSTDPELLSQALRNLIRNAAEAGGGRVWVRQQAADPRVLEFEDDGPGVAPEQLDQLFDWFHTTRAGGSGLGLPSARRALRSLGGDLELVQAHPAIFRLTLGGGAP